ncbi:hypothetical protein GCM10009069_00920 [Algimonas arctica]|uniref:MAPEG family protein n=1 Tax=Algimonas arctica TaxID=1479486 RepID=A0A8J3CK67_9PROT|nr:MAPEG family protein [Algimonas arctica]GHA81685.1 hypothetical protein GCM10009069_00920 [Algimonas arctica]
MPTELQYLISAVGLYLFMILMQTVSATVSRKASVADLVGARDDLPTAGLTTFHGRTKRAQANFTESMVMFVPLCLIAVYSNDTSGLTALGAALFFYGRLVFAPMYYFGVPWLRTLAWFVSIIGILLFFVELLF